ncbi:hypothetical protein [Aeromicrobium sp. 50.2.37]|uniref:hypothetical protein n=1 Tax=Aeromicrobium sp. 50.2.37 TaxID=2969305 RepID=UPI00214F65DD|nr:hypothetical protein [Aeromicrobium sp. 50.2.37]MCR4512958.1 hypothetical protein [Aeromicrobium sp. 50.2.37]
MEDGHKRIVVGAANAWLEAAVRQARRVLKGTLDDGQNVEFMLFSTALNNAMRGAKAVLGKDHPQVASFVSAVPDVQHIRDMLEHFDNYLTGEGRLQSKPTPGGVRAPWMLTATGSESFLPGGSDYSVVVVTRTGTEATQTSFELDVRTSLRACADLVEIAIVEAGIEQLSEAVQNARDL